VRYSFHKFDFDELNDFLTLFNISILSLPIGKNQKHYRNYIKGFRPNKLPLRILSKIYYDEINQEINSPLQKYLTEITKDSFKETKIEELVDSLNVENHYTILVEIFKEVCSTGFNILPSRIFKLADIEVDDNLAKTFDEILEFSINEQNEIKKDCENNFNKLYEEKSSKLTEQLNKCNGDLSKEKNKLRNLEKIEMQKDLMISSREKENNLLIGKLNELNQKIENNKEEVRDFEKNRAYIEKLEIEIKKMKSTILQLEEKNFLLEENSLSPETAHILSAEVLEDLRKQEIKEDEFISKAKNVISKDETLDMTWKSLSSDENVNLNIIIEIMKNNKCNNEDIAILDEIEDCIQYKYIMIKALKVLFYKYLEQKSCKKTIDQNFK